MTSLQSGTMRSHPNPDKIKHNFSDWFIFLTPEAMAGGMELITLLHQCSLVHLSPSHRNRIWTAESISELEHNAQDDILKLHCIPLGWPPISIAKTAEI